MRQNSALKVLTVTHERYLPTKKIWRRNHTCLTCVLYVYCSIPCFRRYNLAACTPNLSKELTYIQLYVWYSYVGTVLFVSVSRYYVLSYTYVVVSSIYTYLRNFYTAGDLLDIFYKITNTYPIVLALVIEYVEICFFKLILYSCFILFYPSSR